MEDDWGAQTETLVARRVKPAPTAFHGLGAAFYPEHMPDEWWERNVRWLADTGLRAVRIGEFWWDRLEPEEDCFDFTWVRQILDLLQAAGVKALMCTPTATPPIWLCERYPEIMPVDAQGRRKQFGGRRHTCVTSPVYRSHCRRVAAALGREFGGHPAILGWQIDNEMGHPHCHCDLCKARFAEWLAQRYGTVAALNEAWGMPFWAMTVERFDQVPYPPAATNPGNCLAWRRFMSDQWVDYYLTQRDALIDAGVRQPITTNMMAPWHGYDHHELGRHADVIGYDYYPRNHPFTFTPATMAFFAAMHRGYGSEEEPLWLMETQVGSVSQGLVMRGQVRYWTWMHLALGTTLVSYFRWDMPRGGSERFHQGIVHPGGTAYRPHAEVKRIATEVNSLAATLAASRRPRARCAILLSFDAWWDELECPISREPLPGAPKLWHDIAHPYQHLTHFRAMMEHGHLADVVGPDADFSRYRLLVVPALTCCGEGLASRLKAFAADGGVVLGVGFTGASDEDGSMTDLPPPGNLAELFGVRVTDWASWPEEVADHALDNGLEAGNWIETLAPLSGTESVLTYAAPALRGETALSRRQVELGEAYYLGTQLDPANLSRFYGWLLDELDLPRQPAPAEGIAELVRLPHDQAAAPLRFIFNTTPDERQLSLDAPHRNLLNRGKSVTALKLKPWDVVILQAE